VKSAGYTSDLAKADFGRQKDFYRLAAMGNPQARRAWNDFAAEDPGSARLVIADCKSDKAERVKVKKSLDKTLTKAEKKSAKAEKSKDPVGAYMDRNAAMARMQRATMQRTLDATENPAEREAAREWLANH
jgi:hypothetical protein